MRRHPFSTEADTYTLFGALFGLLFPLLATLFSALERTGGLSLASMMAAQSGNPLLWIVDSVPLAFALLARRAGIRRDRSSRTPAQRDVAAEESTHPLHNALEETQDAESTTQQLGLPPEDEPEDMPERNEPPVAPSPPTLDAEVLAYLVESLCDGDVDVTQDFITTYLTNAASLIDELRAAFDQGNDEAARHQAHTLKSSSQVFGAMRLAAYCAALEHTDHPSPAYLHLIQTEFARVKMALTAAAESLGSPPPATPPPTSPNGAPSRKATADPMP